MTIKQRSESNNTLTFLATALHWPTGCQDCPGIGLWNSTGQIRQSKIYLYLIEENCTHAMSSVPPVLETQPRVVGEACLSQPKVPNSRPRKLKARMRTTMQHRVIQPIHLEEHTVTPLTAGLRHREHLNNNHLYLCSFIIQSHTFITL